jgi:hypothetical protein
VVIGITFTEATPEAGAAGSVRTTSDSELHPLGPISLIAYKTNTFEIMKINIKINK